MMSGLYVQQFGPNFMKHDHYFEYQNVFLELDYGPYRHMPSWLLALCYQVILIRTIKCIHNVKFQIIISVKYLLAETVNKCLIRQK